MKHVIVEGLRLEYRDIAAADANKPTLVLLHEGLGCVSMWRDFPQKLAAATGCRTVVFSRACYGHSEAYAEPRTPRYNSMTTVDPSRKRSISSPWRRSAGRSL